MSFVTSADEVMFSLLCVCVPVCQQDSSKKLSTNVDEMFEGTGCAKYKQLIIYWWYDLDHDVDTGILREFLPCGE